VADDQKGSDPREVMRASGQFMGFGLTWALAVLLFLGVGAWLDSKLGTGPFLLIIGAFVGAGAGFAPMKYAVTGVSIVALSVLALWPFLDPAGREGIVIAAAIALPIQVGAFAALVRYRGQLNGFLAVWVGGTLLRMLVVGLVAVFAIRSGADGGIPMLLALAGFFFGLLLLEPMYFRLEPTETSS
jgi:hypothetical protein